MAPAIGLVASLGAGGAFMERHPNPRQRILQRIDAQSPGVQGEPA
jgi:hypothetical protein